MIPTITSANILRLIEVFNAYQSGEHRFERRVYQLLDGFNEEELWLLAFVQYLYFWNRLWAPLDESAYYLVPTSDVQRATFEDFINMLRAYTNRKLNPSNEKEFVVFLSRCSREFREFYLAILSKQPWLRTFFNMTRTRDYIDRSLVHPEDIYGELKWYRASFDKLQFPIMVTAVPGELPNGMIVGNVTGTSVFLFRGGERLKLPASWLDTDRACLSGRSFTMLGLLDENSRKFYPTDYFEGDSYKRFLKGGATTPYYQRLRVLDQELSRVYLRQIVNNPRIYTASPAEIDEAVRCVLAGSQDHQLLFTKENQHRRLFATQEVKGVIEGVWTEQGAAKGLKVWHNAQLLNCSYSFKGGRNALLFKPSQLTGKVVRFWLFRHECYRAGCVKEILWDEKVYGRYVQEDGSKGWLEKCAYCAKDGTEVRRKYRGLCFNTVCNLQSLFSTYGPDVWIKPPAALEARREATAWEPYLLNAMRFNYKGYRLVCRESDGHLMFKTDPTAMASYLGNINMNTTWGNWLRESRLKFKSAIDMRESKGGGRGKSGERKGEERAEGVPRAAAGERLDLHGVAGGGRGGRSAGDLPGREDLCCGSEELPADTAGGLPKAGSGSGGKEG